MDHRPADHLPAIPGYEILGVLGTGSMGSVYLAERDGERIAVKIAHPRIADSPQGLARFRREARIGTTVDHPNVVRVRHADLRFDGPEPLLIIEMDVLDGRTLRDLLADLGSLPEPLLRRIGAGMARGLAALHSHGIVHRDLKPENVVITSDQQVQIIDLGIARFVDSSTWAATGASFAGSLPYASPEQVRGERAGPASDLYSLGVVLHELGTGANPFLRENPAAIVHAHSVHTPPPMPCREHGSACPVSHVVASLLAKDPAERMPSAQVVA